MIKNFCSTIILVLILTGCVPVDPNSTLHVSENARYDSGSEAKFKIKDNYEKSVNKERYLRANNLKGKDKSETLEIFGNPSFIRNDLGVALWRYRIQQCVLDIIMYTVDNRDELSVSYLEARNNEGKKLAVQKCIAEFFPIQKGGNDLRN